MVSKERLMGVLTYDPESGNFLRNKKTNFNEKGSIAGCISSEGYIVLSIDKKQYKAHRLAFIYMTGSCPEYVDHINLKKTDNRWSNLRPATKAQNNSNIRSRIGSSSKYLGVNYDKNRGKWLSRIRKDNKQIVLGRFDSEEDAAKAYDKAAKKYHGDFANLNLSV
jgi:hypothetical protein